MSSSRRGRWGRPKGVMLSHRSVRNHNHWILSAFPLLTSDCVLQQSPVIFDVSVWEFFATLTAGATLIRASPGNLLQCIDTHPRPARCDRLEFVPALAWSAPQEPEVVRCRTVRRVISGGAPLTSDLRNRCFDRLGQAARQWLLNSDRGVHLCGDLDLSPTTIAPTSCPLDVQSPIRACTCRLQLELLPIGALGELFIGGVGLARGYINGPDLTADRFLPDPFAQEQGARMTGRETVCVTRATATSSSWAVSTIRSRFTASASNCRRSNRRSARIHVFNVSPSSPGPIRPANCSGLWWTPGLRQAQLAVTELRRFLRDAAGEKWPPAGSCRSMRSH